MPLLEDILDSLPSKLLKSPPYLILAAQVINWVGKEMGEDTDERMFRAFGAKAFDVQSLLQGLVGGAIMGKVKDVTENIIEVNFSEKNG